MHNFVIEWRSRVLVRLVMSRRSGDTYTAIILKTAADILKAQFHVYNRRCGNKRVRSSCRYCVGQIWTSNQWHRWQHTPRYWINPSRFRQSTPFRCIHTWISVSRPRRALRLYILISTIKYLSSAFRPDSRISHWSIRFIKCHIPLLSPYLHSVSQHIYTSKVLPCISHCTNLNYNCTILHNAGKFVQNCR